MAWLVVATAALACGCTPEQYARQADGAAYAVLEAGQRASLGRSQPFRVAYDPYAPRGASGPIRVGDKDIPVVGDAEPVTLTLDDCLGVAVRNSRSFQTRKEQLYAQALALANARRSWDLPLIGGPVEGAASHEKTLGGTETNAGSAEGELDLTQRFAGGAVLALGVTLDFATDFLGGSGTTAGSLLEANLSQPLLRGAWRGLAYEDQYRLERDFLIAVFDYERFTQSFAVDIITAYYNVLQQRDQLANEAANIERLTETLALTRVQAEGGQVSRIQQDQAEQNLLDARVRYEQQRQRFENTLDAFKIRLGLPVTAAVRLDYPDALRRLVARGPRDVPVAEDQAIRVALAARPDVLTQRAALRDARRDVTIAADAFNPKLDIEVGIAAAGEPRRRFWTIRGDEHTRNVGVTFEYDLDQTDNRDAYRNAIIAREEAERDYQAFLDQVRLDVRQSYRSLMQSRRSYEIRVRNVGVAERRRKLARLQQSQGMASARDVLEAEDALRRAQDGLTSTLVEYTTTRLAFLARLGMIRVDEQGRIHERQQPETTERFRKRYADGSDDGAIAGDGS
ncbi:MAG: TolC family protein [Phycisphaerae bacterium]|nr:TolC family protein [Phycisphaerae bacterium]